MEAKKKKRIVILFGAGAAKPWGGKLTCELTKDIIKNSQAKTKTGKNFLSFLQETYANHFYKIRNREAIEKKAEIIDEEIETNRQELHFEKLLSLIEYLFEFYYYQNHNSKLSETPEWIGLFNCIDEIDKEIPGKTLIEKDDDSPYWAYENNPSFRDFSYKLDRKTDRYIIADEYLAGFFFRLLHNEIIGLIQAHVFKYSSDNKYNDKLLKLIESLRENSTLRIYSTNYDDLINDILFKKSGRKGELFNGFDKIISEQQILKHPHITWTTPEIKRYNPQKILNRINGNCFYSLHGSINFMIDINGNREISYQKNTWNQNRESSGIAGNNQILNNTIISGQQKILRTSLEPYKSFFNVFHRDCLAADIILCIGFSFSDFHINQILQQATNLRDKKKEKLKFVNITFSEKEKIPELQKSMANLLNGKELDYMVPIRYKNIKEDWYSDENLSSMGNPVNAEVKTFIGGFEAFLDDEKNWQEAIE